MFTRRKSLMFLKRSTKGNAMDNRKHVTGFDTAKRIRELMEENGDSNYDLAERCGVSVSTVSRWQLPETRIKTDSIEKIAAAYDMTLSQFYQSDFIDRRGDGPTRELRKEWKKYNVFQRKIFVAVGKAAVKIIWPMTKEIQNSSLS